MNRIRRVLLSRAGYSDAWYDGTVLHFHDADGEPANSIISLPNGEGKTTLLSLIFSVLVPRQPRFVQHLQKPDHHFRDYFDTRPGFIVIEMQRPGSGGLFADDPRNLFVAGQVVCLRERDKEPYRSFFSFSPAPDLTFDSLPIRGLGVTPTLDDLTSVRRWLQETRDGFPGFRTFSTHVDWEKHLEEEGADPWLVDRQVDFCGAEGGIDGFLDFRTEADFLRRFYRMALQSDAAEKARETLGEALSKQCSRPQTQDRIGALEVLSASFASFVGAAEARADAGRELDLAQARVGGLHLALGHRRDELISAQERHDQEKTGIEQALKELDGDERAARGREEAIKALRHALAIAEADTQHQAAEQRVNAAHRQRRRVQAARGLNDLRQIEARIEGFRQTLVDAESDIKPVLDRARRAGSCLRARLALEARSHRDSEQKALSGIQEAQAQSLGLTKRINEALEEIGTCKTRLGVLQEKLNARDRALERLAEEKAVLPEEALDAALERHVEAIAEGERRDSEIGRKDKELEGKHAAAEEARASAQTGFATAKQEREQIAERLSKGEALHRQFSTSALLCRLTDAEYVDPDSAGLSESLQGHIRHLDAERQRLNRRLGDLNRDRTSIAATGLAAPDDDAQAALDWLDGHGITQVSHYPAYLAEIVPDAAAACRTLHSDPARFGGLQVYSNEVLERIQALPPGGLELRRPVQVSLSRVEPVAPPADALVLNAPFDAAYNKEAADAYLDRLEAQCVDLERRILERERTLEDARTQAHELDDYLKEFGGGGLDKLRRDRGVLDERIARLETELISFERRRDEIDDERKDLAKELEQLRESVLCTRGLLKSVKWFIEEHERGHAELLESRVSVEGRIKKLTAEIQESQEQGRELGETIEGLKENAATAKEAASKRDTQLAGIAEYDDGLSLMDSEWRIPPMSGLEGAYQTACQALDAVTRDKGLDVLKARIDEAEGSRTRQQDDYQKVRAGMDEAEIEPLLAQDLDALARTAESDQSKAAHEQSTWKERLRTRKGEAKDFTSQRQQPASTAPDLEQAQGSALDSALEQVKVQIEQIQTDQARSKCRLIEATKAIAKAKGDLKQLNTWIGTLEGESSPDIASKAIQLPTSDEQIEALHRECLNGIKQSRKIRGAADAKAWELHEVIRHAAEREPFTHLEEQISVELRGTRFEDGCAAAARHAELIDERIATCRFELDKLDQNLDVVRRRLQSLLDEAVQLLSRATTGSKIPEEVPHFGGQPILKMRARFGGLAPESRSERLRHYIDLLARQERLPASGADLAAELVVEAAKALTADGSLGLAFLKPTDLGPRHMPITKRAGSGGESMTAALFLYLVMAQLRTRSQAVAGHANSGFLILDNPFGKANKVTLIRPQVELARHFGIQLIYATGIQDYNALAEFGHLVRLRRAGTHPGTGRTHVTAIESAEYDVHPEPA